MLPLGDSAAGRRLKELEQRKDDRNEAKLHAKWMQYFRDAGLPLRAIVRNDTIRSLIRKGIPSEYVALHCLGPALLASPQAAIGMHDNLRSRGLGTAVNCGRLFRVLAITSLQDSTDTY